MSSTKTLIIKASGQALDRGAKWKKVREINELAILALSAGLDETTVRIATIQELQLL